MNYDQPYRDEAGVGRKSGADTEDYATGARTNPDNPYSAVRDEPKQPKRVWRFL